MSIPLDQIERARAVPIETEIARRGIKLRRQSRVEHEGPCPRCGGTDRFSINTAKNCWHCRGCKPDHIAGDTIGLVRWFDGVSFQQAVELLIGGNISRTGGQEFPPAARADSEPTDDTASIASALRWWRESTALDGSLGELYLRLHREITELPPHLSEALRYHPRCIFDKDEHGKWVYRPCMLALYRDIISNEPTGVHRVGLNPDATLIGRKAMGRKRGSCVKLWPDEAIGHGLVIGEGIETTIAAAMHIKHRGTLLQPAWAAIDAPGLKGFPPLAGIEYLTVLADHDNPKRKNDGTIWYPGQDAARTCAKRWAKAGIDAEVLTPDHGGSDFNDLIKQIVRRAS